MASSAIQPRVTRRSIAAPSSASFQARVRTYVRNGKPDVGLGEQPDLGRVERRARPGRDVGVAAVLAEHVAEVEEARPRVGGRIPPAAQTGEQRPAFGPERLDRPLEQVGRDASSRRPPARGCVRAARPRPPAAVAKIVVASGERPSALHAVHHDLRFEHAERGGDDLRLDLAEQRAPAREVRRSVRHRDAPELTRARPEPEVDIAGVRLGREVHLADERLEAGGEGASTNPEQRVVDRHPRNVPPRRRARVPAGGTVTRCAKRCS